MNSEELIDALSQPSTEAVTLAVAHLEAIYSQDGPNEYIPTGLLDFDESYGGWRRGALSIVAGRPSMGRTSLVLNSAVYAASVASREALFVTLEHPLCNDLKRLAVETGLASQVSRSPERRDDKRPLADGPAELRGHRGVGQSRALFIPRRGL